MRTWMADSSLLGCESAAALSGPDGKALAGVAWDADGIGKIFDGGGEGDPGEGVPPWGETPWGAPEGAVGDGIECGDESGEEAVPAFKVDLGDEGESICLCESVADVCPKDDTAGEDGSSCMGTASLSEGTCSRSLNSAALQDKCQLYMLCCRA